VSWTHLTPEGFPSGIPGIGDDMDTAMQHAAQPILHSIPNFLSQKLIIKDNYIIFLLQLKHGF